MAEWVLERLNRSHERASFNCGKESLDAFLKTLAGQYERRRVGRTFVATASGQKLVLGYYTSAAGSIALTSLPESGRKGLPRHPLPTIHLGRLAVDLSCRGQGLGETLLFHFLRKALEVSAELGVFAVDVRALDDSSERFYRTYGFISLEDAPFHLFLPMETVEKMCAK